ncbi:hypothetical protein LPJ63_003057 [Coemansia sp. RSA 2711]|nr:hypothetical protein LPJ63_003057 [Coemansia sp. RSA 2711]KAJ2310596.1 hypothetical protein IWW54_003107 [Coemansia sp. RSA 2705]KAJ2318046.1 hypothetical protein IWW52_002786 [Coemansia sp. RSA 2704]KAJ2365544.1 hypothetical protein H4S01_003189 [Coemansia sp. RSA 2610]
MLAARVHTSAVGRAASQFTMPALSPTMTQGGIARWEKKEGESFSAGDLLLQIETDKAQMDVEAQDDGVLVKILAAEGAQNVAVNSPIAIVAEEGDDIASIDVAALSKPSESAKPAEAETEQPEAKQPEAKKAEVKQPEIKKTNSGLLSPAAEFAIHANRVANSGEIEGTGPKGRVLKGDVLLFLKNGKAVIGQAPKPAAPAPSASPAPPAAKPVAAPPTADASTAYLVQALESSVQRHLAELSAQRQGVVVQVPAERVLRLVKQDRAMTVEAFVLRAAALALGAPVGVLTDKGAVAVDASARVSEVAASIAAARANGQTTTEPLAAVLARENAEPLTNAATIVVGAPYAAVSAAGARAALDGALDALIGGGATVSAAAEPTKPTIDVRVTGADSLAAKIKGYLANPELLTL